MIETSQAIEVDSAEHKSTIPPILRNLSVPLEFKHLDVGDYVIHGQTGSLCMSLKTSKDYISSVSDDHLNDELFQMSSNYRWSVLIIHGSPTEALLRRKFNRERYFNYLAGCVLENSMVGECGSISVLVFENEYDVAQFMKTTFKKISTGDTFRDPSIRKIKVPDSQRKLYAIEGFLHGLGPILSNNLKSHFGTIKGIVNASESELLEVHGIGSKKASGLYKIFNEV